MEENTNLTVPYIVFEGTQVRHERTLKRLVAIIIVAIALLFASNAIWLWAWMQYDYVAEDYSYEYSQDGQGINIIGDRNGVLNIEPESESKSEPQNTND